MENLYLEGSPLMDISRRMQDFVLRESFVVNFAVQPMPDFSNENIRKKFEEMVEKLERIPNFGAGPNSTILWTREYSNVSSGRFLRYYFSFVNSKNCSIL
ncbi:unnamed protein product [Angiostrongylus costaricensis]|uniref:Uncharacterized protein n=1 Tax=Angiostrongylus costaricensis TaxID=334426 RepID=A0A0R3PFL7_ANGCS|nr:unnamed protein product [Angiostrongylus costaricensis]